VVPPVDFCFLLRPPFFSFSVVSEASSASLAGSEKHDEKMSNVWWVHFRRALNRYTETESKMPLVRQHRKLEKWNTKDAKRKFPALPMQKLRAPLFLANPAIFFFSLSAVIEACFLHQDRNEGGMVR